MLLLSDSTTPTWVKDQLRALASWLSLSDEPDQWNIERERYQDPTGNLVHTGHNQQLEVDDATAWAKTKFKRWVKLDQAKREYLQVILHMDKKLHCL